VTESLESLRARAEGLLDEARYGEAVAPLQALLERAPSRGIGHRLGYCHLALGDFAEAERVLRREVEAYPDLVNAHNALGVALVNQSKREQALEVFRMAAALDPQSVEAYNNIGNALSELERDEEAIPYFRRVIELKPEQAEAHHNLGLAYHRLRRHEEAIACFEEALRLAPAMTYTLGNLVRNEIAICRWAEIARHLGALRGKLAAPGAVEEPFTVVVVSASPQEQRRCAESYIRDKIPRRPAPLAAAPRVFGGRIRLAYLSADFHEHATSYLIAGLLERHDRSNFEVTGISFGPDDRSPTRRRVQQACDRFFDVRPLDDAGAARRVFELGTDIAIDLKGYTKNARPGILAWRPAPLQVSFLGYPGTMGADFIDYLVADGFVVPEDQHAFYSEKVVSLPDSYQVTDDRRRDAESPPTRSQAGLPPHGFVFCCFNNNFKITPAVFDVWMRLLGRLPGSVLWLLEDNPAARRNLCDESRRRGIDPSRLVFAPRAPQAEHLARQRLADLFLDTLPYNAHTTASDALWAGLPVVTCAGRTFAGRVAGSLLRAVGLPELVTESLQDYEALAAKLAADPQSLSSLKERLAVNRKTAPLFDTDRFRRHIESAYATMWEIRQRGEQPRPFTVRTIA